jgi:hypothetical protein
VHGPFAPADSARQCRASPPDVVLTDDVVDWCLLVGERMGPAELELTVEGDADPAADLLAAAPAFATL